MNRKAALAGAVLAALLLCSCGQERRERRALEFLYEYMPLADRTDYPESFYLENIRSSMQTRREMGWKIPERLFRHFVLPVRVNNENLDSSRVVFARELKPRVKGLTMEQAILEVNHWCHEKVTYQPSDARTLSPLASVKTSLGRCGEESTFCVAALRSVGIPARQVYTPRWAHTDDNHAWVEAWADGRWHFLGACEPEPVLDLGWFNSPASRALLMHTKAFGRYRGPEEILLEGPNYTEINLIDNYASTASARVKVVGEDGRPVRGARVWFCIYNYAEFYPAVSRYTGRNGCAELSAGLGDMLAWAVKDGLYGYSRVRFGRDREVTVALSAQHPEGPQEIDIVPPPENAVMPEVTPEMRAANDARFAREDSVRAAYMATFIRDGGLLERSMGNHEVISAFLERHPDGRARQLLESLSTKDLRDVTPEVLEDSYAAKGSVLCPRVANEFLTPYKGWFLEHLSPAQKELFSDPEALAAWTRDSIRVLDTPDAWRIPMSPVGVWQTRETFAASRDVFFVSLARTLGTEARKDPVTGKVQYLRDGAWCDVDFGSGTVSVSPKGTLVLRWTPTATIANPLYYSHFTLSRIVDGQPRLLSFDEGELDMGGGCSWAGVFRDGATLDAGEYILVSGNRLSSGAVPATLQHFRIEEGGVTALDIIIREPEDGVSVIGTFDADCLLPLTGRGFYALGILDVGKEPTNHALNDIAKVREGLEAWGRPLLLLCSDEAALERFRSEEAAGRYGTLPGTVLTAPDPDGALAEKIRAGANLPQAGLPLFILADSFGRVFFVSQGYTIGLGEQLLGTVAKL